MVTHDTVRAVALRIRRLEEDLRALREAGKDIPAVDRNARRMEGTLWVLRAHFEALAEVLGP